MKSLSLYVAETIIAVIVIIVGGTIVGLLPALLVAEIWPAVPSDEIGVAIGIPICLAYFLLRGLAAAWPEPPPAGHKVTASGVALGFLTLLTLLLVPSILVYAVIGLWWAVSGAAVLAALMVVFLMLCAVARTGWLVRALPRAVMATVALATCYLLAVREHVHSRHPVFHHRNAH